MILRIPSVLTADELRDIRARLEAAPWIDGKVTAGHEAALAKRNQQLAEDGPDAKALGETVHRALMRHQLFTTAALPLRISPPMFNRYGVGMGYGDHIDNALRGGRGVMRGDLSLTLFLSQPDEYDGGELMIEDTGGARSAKLAAGDAILYPAGTVHRVQLVTRGARLASFIWVQSVVRDHPDRALLFDLDRVLGSLRTKGLSGSPEMVMLTGLYHNLLRRWAET